jgi:hypothetical protein
MGLLRKGGLRVPRKVLSLRAGSHRHTMQYFHIVCLLILSIVVSPWSVHAATYYLATNGADAHSGTSAKSWATFAHAWSVMRPGDTLLVKDGIYMQSIAPTVSGTPSNPIIIKAERDGGAIIDGGGSRPALYIYNKGFLTIEGFKFQHCGERSCASIGGHDGPNWSDRPHDIIVRRVAVEGSCFDANCNGFDISRARDSLIEDIGVYGRGRYTFEAYGCDRITVRRAVVRWDGWRGNDYKPGDPKFAFGVYNTHNSLFENIVIIDSAPASRGGDKGALYLPSNDNGKTAPFTSTNNNRLYGLVIVHNDGVGISVEGADANSFNSFTHAVVWGNSWGLSVNKNARNTTFDHLTVGANPHASWFGTNNVSSTVLRNSLIYDNAGSGVKGPVSNDYNNVYGNGSNYAGYASPGPNNISQDPRLAYILRQEDNSPNKRTASDGTDRGATVLGRYVDGVLTDQSLWPWPNEERIKRDFCAATTRGFCSAESLTSYIWRYLGNLLPPEFSPGDGTTPLPASTSPRVK